jgi:Asp/Glu/hydantoin racemase
MLRLPHVLIINPNTSEAVSANIAALAEDEAVGRAAVSVVTARFGAAYIGSRASVAIAAHAVIDSYSAWVAAKGIPDAVVVGCFGDPGLGALREIAPVPVVGFAEAALLEACRRPGRFLVATNGAAWVDMLEELVHLLRIEDHLAAVIELDAEHSDDRALGAKIGRAIRSTGASQLMLGGSGLIPRAVRISADLQVPLIDPHRLAIRQAVELAMATGEAGHTSTPQPSTTYRGLSVHLDTVLSGRPSGSAAIGSSGRNADR